MIRETFFDNFGELALGPDGIANLRRLILQLAVQGKLVAQDQRDQSASELLERLQAHKSNLEATKTLKKQKKLPIVESSEEPWRLPDSWEWSRLGAISNYGATIKIEASDVEDDDLWIIELEDIEKVSSKLLKRVTFGERAFKSSKNVFQKGDVLYGKLRPYLDKVVVADREGACTTEIIPISSFGFVNPEYLRLVLKSQHFIDYANSSTHGMNLPRLGTDKARQALVPIPPIQEQKRIVAKVNELMALCDELEAQQNEHARLKREVAQSTLHHLVHAPDEETRQQYWQILSDNWSEWANDEQTIGNVRDAILEMGVKGFLHSFEYSSTNEDGVLEEISVARENKISQGIIHRWKDPGDIADSELLFAAPRHWQWIRYNNLFRFIDYRGKTPPKVNSGIPLITAKNIRKGFISRIPEEFITEEFYQDWMTRGFPEIGDILLTVEAPLGNSAIVDIEEDFAIAQRTICLQPWLRRSISTQFFNYYIMSPTGQSQLIDQSTGMTATGIKASRLKSLPIPLPPLEEQLLIVAQIEKALEFCENLQTHAVEKEIYCELLLKSLVHHLVEEVSPPNGGGSKQTIEVKSAKREVPAPKETTIAELKDVAPKLETKSRSSNGEKFREAVLVGAIVQAFFDKSSEPLGNFRLQKAVYFARRHMGDDLEIQQEYLRKAAGPYNPAMKYSGGIKIAKNKGYIREAKGRFGFGHISGHNIADLMEWSEKYGDFKAAAKWVLGKFQFMKNTEWELLATVDYAVRHLKAEGIQPTADKVMMYIAADDEWRAKIKKLELTETKVAKAMDEVNTLFA